MAEWMFLTTRPPTDQKVTATNSAAAAKQAAKVLSRSFESEGTATLKIWIVGGPPEEFDATITTTVAHDVSATATPVPPPPVP